MTPSGVCQTTHAKTAYPFEDFRNRWQAQSFIEDFRDFEDFED